jgi:cytochrome c oxidase subunit 2
VLLLAALALPLSGALAQDAQPGDQVCPPRCPASFGLASLFTSAPNEASSITALYDLILVAAGVTFVLVEGALLYTVLRFRRPPELAQPFQANPKLEVAWTAAPALILVVLMGFTVRTMGEGRAAGGSGNVVRLTAIGQQGGWEFRYPDLDPQVITHNELVVPVGSTVEVALEARDGVRGFWAPELFGSVEAAPGSTARLKFTPTTPGAYAGQCTYDCGPQHASMRFRVVVLPAAEFRAWVANAQRAAAPASK